MIFLLVGVREGIEIAEKIAAQGHELRILAKTRTSRENLKKLSFDECLVDAETFHLIDFSKVKCVVDADLENSNNYHSMLSALANKPRYIRFLREELELPSSPLIKTVYSFEEAIEKIAIKGINTIFLTTGSYNLEKFINNDKLRGKRVVVRVLPDWKVIKKCQDMGVAAKDIIAMQGPFSVKINKATFRMYNSDIIVTRDSGKSGGTDNKLAAALETKIPIVVIKRKITHDFPVATSIEEVLKFVCQNH
ncbi:precorrin-6A/cobalt-precorrin-6A reductase [Desulfitibacter alkalitolerans]|uniref:precorrin-6A/cobalt-precorrin-6A reductase n=1 Tax=Desulfitibacter alkalitolerans TaxID=264641 RepID=UPI0006890D23|nr:precorrin-6A/cobalt-precorrin-6A reductase [Desulfitibacter alkalitolerans]